MDQVRIGIIGTSAWTDVFYLPILSRYEKADLAAICGRNQEQAGKLAGKYNIPHTYSDYRQMIDEAKLDALVVAAPDDLHYEMVMAALDAGLHVICEKPLANNADHARQMLDKAESVRIKHMVNYTWRWLPQIRYIKHLLDESYLGRIYQANFRFSFGWRDQREYHWEHDADRSNGVVATLGVHMIDMARWLLGDITSVSAALAVQVAREGVGDRPLNPANDTSFLLLGFHSGTQACIQNSFVTHLADRSGVSVSLYGEKGTLTTNYFLSNLDFVIHAAQRDEDKFHTLEVPTAYTLGAKVGDMFAHFMINPLGPRLFIESILSGDSLEPNFYDGYLSQRIIDAAIESQRSGRRITIS
jgi:predicted dehydrogenase